MLTFIFPMLVRVMSCEVEPPTATLPKSTFVELGTRLGPTPQPATAMSAIAAAKMRLRIAVRTGIRRGYFVKAVEISHLSK